MSRYRRRSLAIRSFGSHSPRGCPKTTPSIARSATAPPTSCLGAPPPTSERFSQPSSAVWTSVRASVAAFLVGQLGSTAPCPNQNNKHGRGVGAALTRGGGACWLVRWYGLGIGVRWRGVCCTRARVTRLRVGMVVDRAAGARGATPERVTTEAGTRERVREAGARTQTQG